MSEVERHVLVVEDNPVDVEVIREAVGRVANARSWIVNDGEEALAFLRQDRGAAAAPRPDLILLDLGLPRLDGRETLERIRQHEAFEGIPVVILTSSNHDEDLANAFQHAADDYVIKPVASADLAETITIWLGR